VRGFHRPHALAQPSHQGQIVGVSAKQRLAEMDMRLDQTGQDIPASGIDGSFVDALDRLAHRDNPVAVNRDVAFENVECVVHRDDDAVSDQERHEAGRLDGWIVLD
jgi:hypothetical protein